MDYAKLPLSFKGELHIEPDEFTLEATRLIVHADKVSFDPPALALIHAGGKHMDVD